jgi:hypothetical protein
VGKISPQKRNGKVVGYSVYLGVDGTGRRQRRYFTRLPDAEKFVCVHAIDPRPVGELFDRKAEILFCLERLRPMSVTLPDVVVFYLRHHANKGNPTLSELVKMFVVEKRRIGRSVHYEKPMRYYLDGFMAQVVVAKLDRLARNAEFLLRLQNSNVDFICCDAPNAGKFSLGILALVAQHEKEQISERTKAALRVVKSRGVRLGTRDPERMVRIMVESNRRKSEEFRSVIRPIIEQIRQTGVTTLKGVAECLNRRGILTRTGKSQWFPSTVRTVIC